MEDILQEFENIDLGKRKIILFINLLFIPICLIVLTFILNEIYSNFQYNSKTDSGTYVLYGSGTLLLATLYLIYKIKKAGWLLLTIISGLIWSFFAKIMFFYITSKWQIESVLFTSLSCFLFLASSCLLAILYLKKARNIFKITITLSTISVYINILIIFIVFATFG